MNDKDLKQDAYLAVERILTDGILRIRAFGPDSPEIVESESDHIHNLPGLLMHQNDELLRFYFEISRESYLRSSSKKPDWYSEPWESIGRYLNALDAQADQ